MRHYANNAARDADTTQAFNSYAYIDTDGTVKRWGGSSWVTDTDGLAGYYAKEKAPVALRASVIAVNASPATVLTLQTFDADLQTNCSTAATTNANVWLDSRIGFYPMTTNPGEMFVTGGGGTFNSTAYSDMTVTAPAGTWYVGGPLNVASATGDTRPSGTITGAGLSSTVFVSPKGTPSALINGGTQNTNLVFQDFAYVGNLNNSGGAMWNYSGTNKNFADLTTGRPIVILAGAGVVAGPIAQRVKCTNTLGTCVILGGTNPQILNSEFVSTVGQIGYLQWQFALSNCTGGQINGLTITSPYLMKSAELFACNGATMTNITGTNVLISANSSTSTTISNLDFTMTTDSFFNVGSGWLDEPIININRNAFSTTGTTGTISNFRVVQQGYIQVSSNSNLRVIQIQSGQTGWTVSGSYPGGGGCTSALGGYVEAPNYNASPGTYYGGMLVMSDAANTTVTGTRSVGTAIGSPGHSSHYGNISLNGANSTATNNVADSVHMGGSSPTTSGNQTNATFCP